MPNTLLDRPAAEAPGRSSSKHRRRRPGLRRRLRRVLRNRPGWLLPAVAVAAGVWVLFAVNALSTGKRELSAAASALSEARDAVASRDVETAGAALERAGEAIDRAAGMAKNPALRLVAPIPVIGSPGKALAAGASAGRHTLDAGRILNDAAAKLPTSGTAAINGHDLSALHRAATDSDAALEQAAAKLELAYVDLSGPAGALLPQVSGQARTLMATIDETLVQLDTADRGLQLVARLTDPATNARLLLLAQDTMEIRPSGGYVGSWGIIKVTGGTISLERYHSFEALPDPEPPMEHPADLADSADRPFDLSNVGFWPDFPTTASTAKELLARQGGGDVDGVIAITEHVMARIVGILGPIQLADYPKPVTEEGFAERVLYEVELKRPLDNPRKKFLQDLSSDIFAKLFTLPADKVPAVLDALGASVGTGDIQAWFADGDWQSRIGGTAIDGALPMVDEGSDFLLITEANVTAGKANADLTRDVHYTVAKDDDGRYRANLRIEYTNAGPASEINPYYNGRIRIYVPTGSEVVGGSGDLEDDGVSPYASIVDSVFVDPDGGKTVMEFEYLLPEGTAPDGHYTLTWLRQPGMGRDALTATVLGRTASAEPGARRLNVDESFGETGLSRFLPW